MLPLTVDRFYLISACLSSYLMYFFIQNEFYFLLFLVPILYFWTFLLNYDFVCKCLDRRSRSRQRFAVFGTLEKNLFLKKIIIKT